MDFDLEELIALVELLDRADFTEFRYQKGDLRLYVRRGPAAEPSEPAHEKQTAEHQTTEQPTAEHQTTEQPAAEHQTTEQPAAEPGTAEPVADPMPADGETVQVTAPLLGNFYRAPKPGEPPFVQIGDKVEPDTVVCIVEVMKLMNSVPAGVTGEVTAVHVQDGALVEFGQPLFSVRPIAGLVT